jgi:glycosyltransferase involved in cell wall biosynthesis
MKIAYLDQYFSTPDLPEATRAYDFAWRLVRDGHEVHVVTTDRRPGAGRRTTVERGITVERLPVPYEHHMSMARRLRSFASFAVRSIRAARAVHADLIVATSTPLTIAIPAIAAQFGRKTPLVFEVRDLWPTVPIAMGLLRSPLLRRAAYALERAAYRHSTRVIALSAEMADGVVDAGYPRDRVRLISNACDPDTFSAPGVSGDRFREQHSWLGDRPLVLYTGTLGRVNAVEAMADIAAAVRPRRPDIRFAIIGDGTEREVVRARAAELGVLDTTFFLLPPMPKQDLPDALAAASVATSFVANIPELGANSSNKVFDALAAGRPVAVNIDGTLPRMLADTGAGLILSRDPADAAGQLIDFLEDEPGHARACAAAAELSTGPLSRDTLYESFAQVLDEALAEGRVRQPLAGRTNTVTVAH